MKHVLQAFMPLSHNRDRAAHVHFSQTDIHFYRSYEKDPANVDLHIVWMTYNQ